MNGKKIFVTGCAGFIGAEVARRLVADGNAVVGIDNMNAYYPVALKEARLARLESPAFNFVKGDIADNALMMSLFEKEKFDGVVNLAAQAGVRYSLQNPQAYIDSNVTGFLNVLECCRKYPVAHLVYASSSSIYGRNTETPFRTTDRTEKPSSLYAVTKKCDELMAETYRHLFKINSTGLRFFTVYGPWGRPDMAPCLFAKAISAGKTIKVFNNGNMRRDFTYIDDIVNGVLLVLEQGMLRSVAENRVYNIGRGKPVDLMEFISILEDALGKKAEKEMLPMQPGDVTVTWADTEALANDVGYRPSVDLKDGIREFAKWYRDFDACEKI